MCESGALRGVRDSFGTAYLIDFLMFAVRCKVWDKGVDLSKP